MKSRRMRIGIPLAVFAGCFLFALVMHLGGLTPTDYTAPNGAFSLRLPGSPKVVSAQDSLPTGETLTPGFGGETVEVTDDGKELLGVAHLVFATAASYNPQTVMRGSVDAGTTAMGGKVRLYVSAPFGRYQGVEALSTTPMGDVHFRVIYTGTDLVAVWSVSSKAYSDAVTSLKIP